MYMCILSNKIQLVRLFWALLVRHSLCHDCYDDRMALTTVRSPDKIDPPNLKKKITLRRVVQGGGA